MTGVVAYLTLVIVIPALALGHQGGDWLPWRWRRAWRGTGPRRALSAPLAPELAPQAPASIPHPKRRSVPSWARAEPYTYEDAA